VNAPSGRQAWGRLRAHVVLIGLMGSGNSTVGRALASRTARPLIDNDEQLRAMTGKTARQLEDDLGSAGLHDLERAALVAALEGTEPAEITAAASVVDDAAARRLLRARARVVWLTAPTEVLAARAASQPHRPLGDDAATALEAQAQARNELFRSVADLVVATDGSVDVVVEEILRAMRAPRRTVR
jgi:shikimate kinase